MCFSIWQVRIYLTYSNLRIYSIFLLIASFFISSRLSLMKSHLFKRNRCFFHCSISINSFLDLAVSIIFHFVLILKSFSLCISSGSRVTISIFFEMKSTLDIFSLFFFIILSKMSFSLFFLAAFSLSSSSSF